MDIESALDSLPPLMSTDGEDKTEVLTINLINGWKYEVYEASLQQSFGESEYWYCFGKVHGFETELGYFSLDEIYPYISSYSKDGWKVVWVSVASI